MIIRVKGNEYEIYLSSNGIIRIEDLGINFANLNLKSINYSTIIKLLYGCLWEKNKLTLDEVGNLFDEYLDDENNSLKTISGILKEEIERWSNKFKKK